MAVVDITAVHIGHIHAWLLMGLARSAPYNPRVLKPFPQNRFRKVYIHGGSWYNYVSSDGNPVPNNVSLIEVLLHMSDTELKTWVEQHESDYAQVRGRLAQVRDILLYGNIDRAADILEKSYMFAVLSIKTERDRHERAFTAHYAGEISRKDAALETVYGGNKKDWIRRTFESTNWTTLAMAVRAHARAGRYATLLDAVVDNLVGVSHRKGAFMLAMAGIDEYMCIDSNVARYAGYEESDDGATLSFSDSKDYFNACHNIRDKTGIEALSPFVLQWAIYDYERGEHARHMPFFQEVLE